MANHLHASCPCASEIVPIGKIPRLPAPIFLATNPAYLRYLQDGVAGHLSLPAYDQTPNGEVIVYPGEVFCRLPNCEHRRIPLAEIRNLRDHIRRHGVMVAWAPSGRVSQTTMNAVITWYEALFISQGSGDNGDDQQDE
ncbi:unnamed protein product [Penicillium glandicola]